MKQLSEEQKQKDRLMTFEYQIQRSAAFQRTFTGKDGELVLSELKANLRGFDPDPYVHAFNAGIRWWWDFIQTAMSQDVEGNRKILEEHKKEQGAK